MTQIRPGTIVLEEDVRIPGDIFDLKSFRRWVHSDEFPQRGRYSFIAGQIEVDMSPEEIESHNKLKTALTHYLWEIVEERNLGEILTDGVLFVNEEADVSHEPDLIFCSWDGLRSGRVRYEEFVEGSQRYVELCGSPDLVVEIISRSSVRKDTKLLRERYFLAGVKEYWLIDARSKKIDFRLLTSGKDRFVKTVSDSKGYLLSKVLGRRLLIRRRRNPVGGFSYQLLHR